jgi:hypothetical protein
MKKKIRIPNVSLIKKVAQLDDDVLQYGKQLSGLMEDKRWQGLSRRGKMRLYNSYLKRLKQQKGPTFRIFNKDGSPNFGD